MKKYIYPVLLTLIFLLLSCTITPEETQEKELKKAVTRVESPLISSVITTHSETSPSITVLWEPVENATFYVFEYESANEYLSGNKAFSECITNSNSFTLPSSAFPSSSDMRFVFRVKAAYKPSSTRAVIYSDYSETTEAAVVNTFTITPIIEDDVLTLYASFPKIKSALRSGNIIQPSVRYYEIGDDGSETALESNTLKLSSAETKRIKGELIVDGEVVTEREITVKTATNYYPEPLTALSAGTNEDSILLSWSAKAVNKGLEEYNTKMRFIIERREAGETTFTALSNERGEIIYVEGNIEGGSFSYSDTSAEEGKDYVYRVITQYVLSTDESEIVYEEKREKSLISNTAYTADKKVSSFILTPLSGFTGDPVTTGDAEYTVDLSWECFHSLKEGSVFEVTRWDFDMISFVDGTPTDESEEESKYSVVYKGRDYSYKDTFTLSQGDNKTSHSYTYFIQIKEENKTSDNPYVQAKKEDEEGNLVDGIVKTNPSVKEISFISSFKAESHLSDRINLTWEYNESDILSMGLDKEKVSVHILKKTSTDNIYSDICEVKGTSYSDYAVEGDTTYSYILVPYYDDETSPYNGKQRAESDKMPSASILSDVTKISATINKSNESITVEWDEVDSARFYVVYSRVKGTDTWTESLRTEKTKATLSEGVTPGVRYEITVSPMDKEGGVKALSKVKAEGEILGAVNDLKATGDENIQSDSIILSWNKVENATSYVVSVYDSKESTEPIYTETIPAKNGTTYTFSSSSEAIKAYATTQSYALSKEYYFTLTPMADSIKAEESTNKTKGYWVMPPKNIKAEKAVTNDRVIISWTKEDGVDGYYLYYSKTKDFSNAAKIYISSSKNSYTHIKTSCPYYYSLSSVSNRTEGVLQTYFDSENSNYGYPLLPPSQVYSTELENKVIQYSFLPALGATSYKVKVQSNEYTIAVTDGKVDTSKTSSELKDISVNNDGTVTFKVNRPDVTTAATIYSSISSVNDSSEAIALYNESSPVYCDVALTDLYPYEYVNLIIYGMMPLYEEAEDRWDSDWWQGTDQAAFKTASGTVNFKRPKGLYSWGASGLSYNWDNGTVKFTNYSFTDTSSNTYTINGEIINKTEESSVGKFTYESTSTNVKYLIGTITVTSPSYLGGQKTIEFKEYNIIDYKGGQILLNGTAVDLSRITNHILEGQK